MCRVMAILLGVSLLGISEIFECAQKMTQTYYAIPLRPLAFFIPFACKIDEFQNVTLIFIHFLLRYKIGIENWSKWLV